MLAITTTNKKQTSSHLEQLKLRFKVVRRLLQVLAITRELQGVYSIQKELFYFYPRQYRQNARHGLKFLWQYLSNRFSRSQRVTVLQTHYKLANQLLNPTARAAIAQSEVALFSLKPADSLHRIVLSLPQNTQFEGDLLLKYRFNDTELFRITFSFTQGACIGIPLYGQAVLIGGSQGTVHTGQHMRQAAKELEDTCPSTLCFLALQALCSELKIPHILGIPADQHVCAGVQNNTEAHRSTYDHFWANQGGIWDAPLFVMGTTPHLKDLSLIPSSHRRRAKRRQQRKLAFFEQMNTQIRALSLSNKTQP